MVQSRSAKAHRVTGLRAHVQLERKAPRRVPMAQSMVQNPLVSRAVAAGQNPSALSLPVQSLAGGQGVNLAQSLVASRQGQRRVLRPEVLTVRANLVNPAANNHAHRWWILARTGAYRSHK
jgi:hypothetical protein